MKTYTGSCHCGAVRFSVESDFTEGIECNCSHCHRKGFVLSFVPAEAFTLIAGEDSLTDYLFNKKTITHRFCKICGVQPFAISAEMGKVAVNLRCVDDLDLATLSIDKVNGKDF